MDGQGRCGGLGTPLLGLLQVWTCTSRLRQSALGSGSECGDLGIRGIRGKRGKRGKRGNLSVLSVLGVLGWLGV